MAYKIIDSVCTCCSACEAECPNVAIREKKAFTLSMRKSAPSASAISTRRNACPFARSTTAV